MSDIISKIQIGTTSYDISDATARAKLANLGNALQFIGLANTSGDTNFAEGLTTSAVIVGGQNITAASGAVVVQAGLEYLYDGSKWNKMGDESSYILKGALGLSFTKDNVLGADTSFSVSKPSITVTPTNKKLSATSGDITVTPSKLTFLQSYAGDTSKLATTSFKPVSDVGSATAVTLPTFTYTAETQTLVITAGSVVAGKAPTLGSDIRVATGSLSSSDSNGATIMTGLGKATSTDAVVSFTVTKPTITIAKGDTGDVDVVSSVAAALSENPSVTVGTNDIVAAVITGSITGQS